MSLGKQGVFPAPESGDFSKNSGILQLVEKVPFVCALWAGGSGLRDSGNKLDSIS